MLNLIEASERFSKEGLTLTLSQIAELAEQKKLPGSKQDWLGRWQIPEDVIVDYARQAKQQKRPKCRIIAGSLLVTGLAFWGVLPSFFKDLFDFVRDYVQPLFQSDTSVYEYSRGGCYGTYVLPNDSILSMNPDDQERYVLQESVKWPVTPSFSTEEQTNLYNSIIDITSRRENTKLRNQISIDIELAQRISGHVDIVALSRCGGYGGGYGGNVIETFSPPVRLNLNQDRRQEKRVSSSYDYFKVDSESTLFQIAFQCNEPGIYKSTVSFYKYEGESNKSISVLNQIACPQTFTLWEISQELKRIGDYKWENSRYVQTN